MSALQVKSSQFSAQPDSRKTLVRSMLFKLEHKAGAVFGLVKLLGTVDERRERMARIIHDHLQNFQQTLTDSTNIPRRFEQVLQAINDDIAQKTKERRPFPIEDLHAVIGVQFGSQLFLSGIGNLSALFLHRTAKQRYVVYELDRQFANDEKSWTKPFLTVLDGELHPGDAFYVGTKLSHRELRLEDLQDILVTLPPSGALKRIHQYVQTDAVYGAVAFQISEPRTSGAPKKVNPFTSIEQLTQTKNETAGLLGEQTPDIGGWLSRVTAPLMDRLSSPGTSGTKSIFKRFLVISLRLFVGAVAIPTQLLSQITSTTLSFYQRWRNAEPSEEQPQNEPAKPRKSVLDRLQSLPPNTKYFGLGAAVIVLILIGTISMQNTSSAKREAQQAFDTIVSRVEEKKDAAEASLIYNDKNQARSLLAEAVLLLEQLPTDTQANVETVESLRTDVNAVFYQLRGVTEVDVQTLGSTQTPLTSFAEAGGSLYAIGENNQLLTFNELNLAFEFVDATVGSIDQITAITGEGSNLLFVDDAPRLGRVDTANASINPIVSGVDGLSSVADLSLYNESLYVLSPSNQQIVKYRPQAAAFDGGSNWIVSLLSDLSEARSMAIDGDIYVLTNSDILRFNGGKEVTFSFETVDPILTNPIQIWTTVDTDFVYVLDPSEARVVVYSKSGDVIAQYVDDALQNAISMIVREDRSEILIGTASSLLSFTATHLVQ